MYPAGVWDTDKSCVTLDLYRKRPGGESEVHLENLLLRVSDSHSAMKPSVE